MAFPLPLWPSPATSLDSTPVNTAGRFTLLETSPTCQPFSALVDSSILLVFRVPRGSLSRHDAFNSNSPAALLETLEAS